MISTKSVNMEDYGLQSPDSLISTGHLLQKHFKYINRDQCLANQIEVPICQYLIPLPRVDQPKLLLCTATAGGSGSVGSSSSQANRDNNRSSEQVINVTPVHNSSDKATQLFLEGTAMSTPGPNGDQPLESGLQASVRRHGRRGMSPHAARSSEAAAPEAEPTPRETATSMSGRRSEASRAMQLPSITYGSETTTSRVDYVFNSNRYLDSYISADLGQEEKDMGDLDLATLRLKRKRTTPRKDTSSPRPTSSGRGLKQCLVISNSMSSSPPVSPEEERQLKHHTFVPKFSKRERKLHSGLYASVPSSQSTSDVRSSRSGSTGSYKFTSIDSYLKYNGSAREDNGTPGRAPSRIPVPMDINASVMGQGSTGSSTQPRSERRVRSKHRAETTSLTSGRESDVAALKDLDEYFVVTTPHIEEKSTKSLRSGKSSKSRLSDKK